jgi:AcrR family transcriptional regulator
MRGRKAKTEQERAQRRQKLIEAARGLLDEQPFQDITIAQIAATAGVAKGTTYLYFRTREELFCNLLLQEMQAWRDHLEGSLCQMRGGSVEQLAQRLTHSFLQRPVLMELLRWMHAGLEQNLSEEAALLFRQRTARIYRDLGHCVEEAAPALAGQGSLFLRRAHVVMVGLTQLATPAPIVKKVLAREPSLALLRGDLRTEMITMLTALLYSMVQPQPSYSLSSSA